MLSSSTQRHLPHCYSPDALVVPNKCLDIEHIKSGAGSHRRRRSQGFRKTTWAICSILGDTKQRAGLFRISRTLMSTPGPYSLK